MKKYDVILFDLDGTLTDPADGIINSVIYALSKYNISVDDRRSLYKFIGPPLLDSFMEYYGFSESQAYEAIEFYRERFRAKGMFENSVYNGIEELLISLKNKGKRLIVATSKPEEFSVKILEHFNLSQYFEFIAGSNLDGSRSAKADVITYALESCGINDKSGAIMIGDRKHDIIGANAVGLDSIGVLFGYGDLEELKAAGATYIADSVDDINKLLSL